MGHVAVVDLCHIARGWAAVEEDKVTLVSCLQLSSIPVVLGIILNTQLLII